MEKTREEIHKDYDGFVEKFKPKKTTDDCYTPPVIYDAIKEWACKEYGIDPDKIVRPFYPGGDYENYEYEEGAVVLDNPPFSILGKIVDFYRERKIPFFLFAPSLTVMGYANRENVNLVIADCDIVYENGARVRTAFVTSFGEYAIEANPELHLIVKKAVAEFRKENKKELPKYSYPLNVMMANEFQKLAKCGIKFGLKRSEFHFVRKLDSQKQKNKVIYGSGVLISNTKAAERAAAERAAHIWELSERELEIIESLI